MAQDNQTKIVINKIPAATDEEALIKELGLDAILVERIDVEDTDEFKSLVLTIAEDKFTAKCLVDRINQHSVNGQRLESYEFLFF